MGTDKKCHCNPELHEALFIVTKHTSLSMEFLLHLIKLSDKGEICVLPVIGTLDEIEQTEEQDDTRESKYTGTCYHGI